MIQYTALIQRKQYDNQELPEEWTGSVVFPRQWRARGHKPSHRLDTPLSRADSSPRRLLPEPPRQVLLGPGREAHRGVPGWTVIILWHRCAWLGTMRMNEGLRMSYLCHCYTTEAQLRRNYAAVRRQLRRSYNANEPQLQGKNITLTLRSSLARFAPRRTFNL